MASSLIAYSAMVKIFVSTNAFSGTLPATKVRVYYGSGYKNYTNNVVLPLSTIDTNLVARYDANLCSNVVYTNFYVVPVYGLVLNQPFFYGVKYINTNGEETEMLYESECAFIVTNQFDVGSPPQPLNVRISQ
jgi:hypothetical protein